MDMDGALLLSNDPATGVELVDSSALSQSEWHRSWVESMGGLVIKHHTGSPARAQY